MEEILNNTEEQKKPDIEDIRDKAKAYVKKRYAKLSDRGGLVDKWNNWEKLYNNITYGNSYTGFANLFSPETRKCVRALENFVDESLFGQNPNFKIQNSAKGEMSERNGKSLTDLIFAQMQEIKFRDKIRKFVNYLLVYGIAVVKPIWVKRYRRIKKYNELTGKTEVEFIAEYDNIDLEIKDIRSVFFDPFVKDYKLLDCVIEKNTVTLDYLKQFERTEQKPDGIYDNLKELEDDAEYSAYSAESRDNVSTVDNSERGDEYLNRLTGLSNNFETGKKIQILEAWCYFDVDGDGKKESAIIVLANNTIIRMEENPYWLGKFPYIFHQWEEIHGTILGMGIPQLAEKSQIALNDFLNQIMDNISHIINNMWVKDRLANINNAQLKSRQNGVIECDGNPREVLQALEKPNTVSEGLQAVALSKEDIRGGTGVPASLQSLPSKYGTTATEAGNMYASAARDVFSKLRRVEDCVVVDFLDFAVNYDLQFMSRTQFINYLGEQAANSTLGVEGVTLEKLRGTYHYIPLGLSTMENRIVSLQQEINFLNIALKLPDGIVNLHKLSNNIWQKMGGTFNDGIIFSDPTETLIKPEEENLILQKGEFLTPHPNDNVILHLSAHQSLGDLPNVVDHINKHIEMVQLLAMQKQIAAQGVVQPNNAAVPPQEQPRTAPGIVTENEIANVQQEFA